MNESKQEYWVDDDGFIAQGTGDDYITIAEILEPEHIEPLTKFIKSHAALLAALKDLQKAVREHGLLDIKKRFSLCNADAQANKAIFLVEKTV